MIVQTECENIRWLATAVVQRPELEINRLAFAFHPPPTANLEHV